jgi:hypothetical protein
MTEDPQLALALAGLAGRFTALARQTRFGAERGVSSNGVLHDQVLEHFR